MFDQHNAICNEYLQDSPDNLRTGVMMVALSIQQPWRSVGTQLRDWSRVGGRSRFLWGNKAATHAHLLRRGKIRLYDRLRACSTDAERMDVLIDVPGLGLPKAGFVVQLWSGGVGCIDLHNIRAYSPPPGLLRMSGSESKPVRERKINTYVDWCAQIGSATLWNNWCDNLSQKDKSFPSGEAVSEAHVNYLLEVA